MIFFIIFCVAVVIILTEFLFFFGFTSEDIKNEPFVARKILSLMSGCLITSVFCGIPYAIASKHGNIAYVWIYGVIVFIAVFFGINYYFDKKRQE